MKIMIGVDGSPQSDAAVKSVAARPWPADSEVRLIAVVELHIAPVPAIWAVSDNHYLSLLHELQEKAHEALAHAAAWFASTQPDLLVTTETLNGNIKAMLVKEAEDWGADLLVVGSHGHNAVERFLLGSVSNAVMQHAPCSVEVVRQRAQAAV